MDVDVDLRLLRSFVTMAEESNVGRAARRLYISQPALSKQLQRLEAFLDAELFHRHHRMLRLTPAGRIGTNEAGMRACRHRVRLRSVTNCAL